MNVAGSATHTFTMTFTDDGAGGGDEVTIAVVELFGVAMVDSSSHVERAIGSATIQGTAVTPTRRRSRSRRSAATARSVRRTPSHAHRRRRRDGLGWRSGRDRSRESIEQRLHPDRHEGARQRERQLRGAVGQRRGRRDANEGGQLFQAVFQLAAGVLATGAIQLGDNTAAGEGVLPLDGAGALQLEDDAALGAGAIDVAGAAAIALGADTAAGTGAVESVGAAAMQLDDDVAAGVARSTCGARRRSCSQMTSRPVAARANSSAMQRSNSWTTSRSGPARCWCRSSATRRSSSRTTAASNLLRASYASTPCSSTAFTRAGCTTRSRRCSPTRKERVMSDEKILNQNETPKTIRARAFTSEDYVDLTTWTSLTFKMTGPATTEGAASGDAAGYAFTGAELAVPGTYAAQFRGIDASGQPRTIPEVIKLRVVVLAVG